MRRMCRLASTSDRRAAAEPVRPDTTAGGGGGRVAVRVAQSFDFDAGSLWAAGAGGTLSHGGPGTVLLARPDEIEVLRVDNEGLTHLAEVAPWAEIGRRQVAEVTAHTVTVSGAPWVPVVILDGTIGANGEDSPEQGRADGAGGAGGSIHIVAGALSGQGGAVSARGGAGASGGGGGGGGGRVAIEAGEAADWTPASLDISGGSGSAGSEPALNGGAGSLVTP